MWSGDIKCGGYYVIDSVYPDQSNKNFQPVYTEYLLETSSSNF